MFRSNKPWPLHLNIDVHGKFYRYTPRSDLCITLNGFPVFLLEVTSNSNSADWRRMLLQAACLVRLGNVTQNPIPELPCQGSIH